MEKLIPLLTKSKNGFSIFSTNIQSIRAKFDELQIFVEHLRSFNFEFSAICTQERIISDKDDLSQIELKGYTLIPQGKSCGKNGGLVIYLYEQFKHEYKLKLNKQNSWEGQFMQIRKGENFIHSIIIGNIYRPPNDLISSY